MFIVTLHNSQDRKKPKCSLAGETGKEMFTNIWNTG